MKSLKKDLTTHTSRRDSSKAHARSRSDRTRKKKKSVILDSLRNCATILTACENAGVGRRTFYEWTDSDPEFAEDVEAAQASVVSKVGSAVLKGALQCEENPGFTGLAIWVLKCKGKKHGWREHDEAGEGKELPGDRAQNQVDGELEGSLGEEQDGEEQ